MTAFLAVLAFACYLLGAWTMILLLLQLERRIDPDRDLDNVRAAFPVALGAVFWPLLSAWFGVCLVRDVYRDVRPGPLSSPDDPDLDSDSEPQPHIHATDETGRPDPWPT